MNKASSKTKKSNIEKYFAQKNIPVHDVLFGAIAVIGIIVWFFWFFYAIYGAIIGAVGLFLSRSMRIKSSEVDEFIAKLEKDNGIDENDKNISCIFDLRISPIIKDKFGKLRTSKYVICKFDTSYNKFSFSVCNFNLIENTVSTKEYSIDQQTIKIITEDITTPYGIKKVSYISCELFEENIPIDINNINISNIIDKICN